MIWIPSPASLVVAVLGRRVGSGAALLVDVAAELERERSRTQHGGGQERHQGAKIFTDMVVLREG